MAGIIKCSINLNLIPKDKIINGKKGKYLPIVITVNDEVDPYGNQGPVIVEQSKEERESKKDKIYLGNAKVVWGNGVMPEPAPYEGANNGGGNSRPAQAPQSSVADDDDLPF